MIVNLRVVPRPQQLSDMIFAHVVTPPSLLVIWQLRVDVSSNRSSLALSGQGQESKRLRGFPKPELPEPNPEDA